MQRARFRRTVRLAAERSSFYREQFRKRGIDVRRIEHPSELGDFYTTGEDLREHGAEAFLTGHADTAFETTGTTSPIPKRVFFSQRELSEIWRTSAIGLYHLGVRAEDRVLSAYDCSFWDSPAVLRRVRAPGWLSSKRSLLLLRNSRHGCGRIRRTRLHDACARCDAFDPLSINRFDSTG